MITNKEIAKALNISPSTVSLALNNKKGVSEKMRRRIMSCRDSALRKNLANDALNLKGTIGFSIFKKHGNIISETPFFVALTEAVDAQAGNNSYGINLSYYNQNKNIHAYLESLNQSDSVGFLILATELSHEDVKLIQQVLSKPFVLIDGNFPWLRVDTVLMNNSSGIIQSMKYGYQLGHRNIGFLKSKVETTNLEDRFDNYRNCLFHFGLPFQEKFVFELGYSIEAARTDMLQYIESKKEMPTLFIAANDVLALGAMKAFCDTGWHLPEDFSFLSFDDSPSVEFFNPPLSSVRLNHEAIAKEAVRRLIEKLESVGEFQYSVQKYVDVELVIRESVVPPKA